MVKNPPSNAGDVGLIPGWGGQWKIPHTTKTWRSQKKKKEHDWEAWWRRAEALGSGWPDVESWLCWVTLGGSVTVGLNFLNCKLGDNNRVVVKIKWIIVCKTPATGHSVNVGCNGCFVIITQSTEDCVQRDSDWPGSVSRRWEEQSPRKNSKGQEERLSEPFSVRLGPVLVMQHPALICFTDSFQAQS